MAGEGGFNVLLSGSVRVDVIHSVKYSYSKGVGGGSPRDNVG